MRGYDGCPKVTSQRNSTIHLGALVGNPAEHGLGEKWVNPEAEASSPLRSRRDATEKEMEAGDKNHHKNLNRINNMNIFHNLNNIQ